MTHTPWNDISEAPMDGTRLLLTVMVAGKPRTVIGGYDNSWSGKCWVYENPRVPAGSVPIGWKPLDAPMDV